MSRAAATGAASRLARWLWLLCVLLGCGGAFANPAPLVRLKVELVDLDAGAEAVEAARQASALASDGQHLTLPYRDRGSWLRITPALLPVQSVLVIEGNVSGPMALVLPYGARLTQSKLRPARDGPVSAYAQVFTLPDALARGTPLLLHLSHEHRATVRVKLMDAQAWRTEERRRLVATAIFYAAVVTFAFIAACYWAVLRERMLGEYTLYLFALMLFTACNAGYLYAWPGGALWARLGIHGQWLLASLALGLSLGFTHGFLALPRQAPRLARLYEQLRGAALAAAVLLLLSPVHLPYAGVVLSLAALPIYLLMLGTGIVMTLRGNRYALYYILGWTPLTASVILRALQGMGYRLPFEGELAYGVCMVWQALVLTIGVAEQVLSARRERDLARQAAAQAAQLEVQNTVLKENMRLREEVERMSRHDLKTPLASIVALPRLVREAGPLNTDQAELLGLVERAGYRVLNMVNLSLDVLKMEQGRYRFTPAAVDLERLLHQVAGDLGALATERRVTVRLRIERDPATAAPLQALAEETLCYSILANLLKNAIEAAPEASTVTIALEPGDPLGVRIHNFGAVPEAVRGRFFEKYATAGKSGGSGFGTYSARLMARIQEGELGMRTDEAEGTTLSLRLRSAAGHGAAPAPAPVPEAPPPEPGHDDAALPPLSVLIVDDDEYNLLVLRRSLSSPPLALRTATSGHEALQAQAQQPADVIFMDLEMPAMSGFEAVQALRRREKESRCKPTLVVALTSHEDEATRRRCLQAGFDLYLSKPVRREELLRALRGAGGTPGTPAALPPALPLPGPEAALELDPDLRDALPSFLQSRRAALEDMAQALQSGDDTQLRRIAHRLAGSFALHGFRWAADCCQRIEHARQDAPADELQAQLETLRLHLDTVRITFAAAEA
jgi:CheY-like chemotaxis protein